MRALRLLVLLVAWVAAIGLGWRLYRDRSVVAEFSPQAPATGPTPPAPAPRARPALILDLASQAPKEETPRAVSPGVVRILLQNRAPHRAYVIEVRDDAPHGLSQKIRLAPNLQLTPARTACSPLNDAVASLYAADEESEAVARRRRAQDEMAKCPSASTLSTWLSSVAEETWSFVVQPERTVEVTVSRLASNGETADREWTLRLTTAAPAGTPHPTEAEWIVTEVARDIAGTLVFAKDGSVLPRDTVEVRAGLPASGGPALTVSVRTSPPASARVAPEPHIWAPEAYASLVRSLKDSLGLRPKAAAPAQSSPAPEALLVPRVDVMEEQNRRISQRLSEDPLDARAHEDAALLLGVLGLREASGPFRDLRPTLCRMTSHLALAEGFRGARAPGTSGALARVVLSSLAGRKREAQDAIDAFRRLARTDPEKAWARALTLRNTKDWTLLPRPETATLLERLELLRAIRTSLGSTRSHDSLRNVWKEPLPDWGRISLGGSLSLEDGHAFVDASRALDPLDLVEMRHVFPEALPGEPTGPQLAAALNLDPTPLVAVSQGRAVTRVISPGHWAAFFQRHLLGRVFGGSKWLRYVLSTPEQADAYEANAASLFGALRLAPVLSLHLARVAGEDPKRAAQAGPILQAACPALIRIALDAPALLSASSLRTAGRCAAGGDSAELPSLASWFRPLIPPGTAYDAYPRLSIPEAFISYGIPDLEEIHRLNPFDRDLAWMFVERKFQGRETPEQFASILGPLVDYDVTSMRRLMDRQKDRPAEYRKTFERMCGLVPEQYMNLGEYLVDQGLDAEALAAYEKGSRLATPVAVSNGVRWLVNYYYDHGKTDRALALARDAASTGSHHGLETLARLYERLADPAKAEEGWLSIQERYGVDDGLRRFYARQAMRGDDRRFGDKPKAALEKVFPKGVAKIAAAPPPALPVSGPTLVDMGSKLERCGLRRGDVIVGIDGYRVETVDQLEVVRLLSQEPAIRFIVRRGASYVELSGNFTGRILVGANIQ